jgi:hypothetical protein
MNIFSAIQKAIGGQRPNEILLKCSGFRCGKVFTMEASTRALPEHPICPTCEERFNVGIQQWIHAHSGHTTGNYHLLDGWDRG